MLDTRDRLHAALTRLVRVPSVYSLIHADMHPGNVLVDADRLTVIDFDDAAWGWHAYDIAVALVHQQDGPNFAALERAYIKGYRSVRPISDRTLELLPMFRLCHITHNSEHLALKGRLTEFLVLLGIRFRVGLRIKAEGESGQFLALGADHVVRRREYQPEEALVGLVGGQNVVGYLGDEISRDRRLIGGRQRKLGTHDLAGIKRHQVAVLAQVVVHVYVGEPFHAAPEPVGRTAGATGDTTQFAFIACKKADDEVGLAKRVCPQNDRFAHPDGHTAARINFLE
jgi:hypothetical protein